MNWQHLLDFYFKFKLYLCGEFNSLWNSPKNIPTFAIFHLELRYGIRVNAVPQIMGSANPTIFQPSEFYEKCWMIE